METDRKRIAGELLITGELTAVGLVTGVSSQLKSPRGPNPQSIGAIVGSFKSAATRRINIMHGIPGAPIWQRNYHEHIIRNEHELNHIRRYIAENPLRLGLDHENPNQHSK